MRAKLIKEANFYGLKGGDKIIGTSDCDINSLLNYPFKLSFKNCEAIERGYNLDELAHIRAEILNSYTSGTKWADEIDKLLTRYREVIELMGDKKFNEEDVRIAMDRVWDWCEDDKDKDCSSMTELRNKHIQSLQQTEWDVEIEMECVMGCQNLILNGENSVCCGDKKPKLDADGCLILKRI